VDGTNPFPLISVVIPVRNAPGTLELCLRAVFSSRSVDFEVIVVDDSSSDDTPDVALKYGCVLIRLSERGGPARARNRGVEASRGAIILFIDSDIIIHDETLSLVAENFSRDAETAAVVGMLDERAHYKNLPSRFFNLRKHYDYHLINNDLSNLYTAITAVRKGVFVDAGGFDERYTEPSVEDAELGRRLSRAGRRIVLDKRIRVLHLKNHSLKTLLASDFSRGAHFMKFLLRERLAPNIVKEKRFGSFRLGMLATVTLSPLLLFILANRGFLGFTSGVLGWKKNLLMPLVIFIDSLAVSAGILTGLAGFIGGKRF
jgi:glycosyltransferase involved in cell wall biosynthesis